MRPKPEFLGDEFAAQYRDEAMARAYPARPPYPDALFDLLAERIDPDAPFVLDAGCGSGDLARPLAARAARVDALDPSPAMLAVGRSLPGADRPNLRWILGSAETAPLDPPYGLVTAGQSLPWMDWGVVLPRWRDALSPRGRVALVERMESDAPWWPAIREIARRRSKNRAYRAYDLRAELEQRGLFGVEEVVRVEGEPLRRDVDRVLDGLHSMNGLSRTALGPDAPAFDAEVRAALAQFTKDGVLETRIGATLTWGRPA